MTLAGAQTHRAHRLLHLLGALRDHPPGVEPQPRRTGAEDMASETYHEPLELLSEPTRNLHRGIISLIEELEAVDWYQQRADACSDPELKAVLIHNLNEEIEHATMTLEWVRRQHPVFDRQLRRLLFTTGSIAEKAEEAEAAGTPAEPPQALGIGSLRPRK